MIYCELHNMLHTSVTHERPSHTLTHPQKDFFHLSTISCTLLSGVIILTSSVIEPQCQKNENKKFSSSSLYYVIMVSK